MFIRFTVFCCIFFCVQCSHININKKEQILAKISYNFFDDTRANYIDKNLSRPIFTEILFPSGIELWPKGASSKKNKHPLIVLSHGHGGSPKDLAWLSEKLAKNGFIVASIAHHGDSWPDIIPKAYIQIWDRALDVKFLLKKLFTMNISSFIDKEKIAMAGFSLGGTTSAFLIGAKPIFAQSFEDLKNKTAKDSPFGGIDILKNFDDLKNFKRTEKEKKEILTSINFKNIYQDLSEPKIKAAILMAPSYGQLFTQESINQIKIPSFVITPENDRDTIAPIQDHAKRFANDKAILQILLGKVGHFIFLPVYYEQEKKYIPKFLWEDDSTVDRQKIHEKVSKDILDFLHKNLLFR